MKVRSFQEGGFVQYTPLPRVANQVPNQVPNQGNNVQNVSGKESSDEKKKSEGLPDFIVKELMSGKGIPADINSFLKNYEQLFSGNLDLVNSPIDRKMYSQLLGNLNELVYNKEQLDNALKESSSRQALGELAISSYGGIYVMNKDNGKMEILSVDEFDPEVYKPMTNSEIANYRRYDPKSAWNSNIAIDIQQSTSNDEISKNLWQQINNVKNQKTEQSSYIKKIQDGIDQITGEGPSGYYEFTTATNTGNLGAALDYLWNGLSPTEKNLLIGKSAINGSKNPVKDAKGIIAQMLNSVTDVKSTSKYASSPLNEKDDKSKSGESGESGKLGPTVDFTSQLKIANRSGQEKLVSIMPSPENGDKVSINLAVPAVEAPFVDKNQDTIASFTPIKYILNDANGGWGSLLDTNNVYFGNNKVNSTLLENITTTANSKQVYNVSLPVVPGTSQIDWNMVDRIKEADKKIEELNDNKKNSGHPPLNENDKRKIYMTFDVDPDLLTLNKNKVVDKHGRAKFKNFLMLTTYAVDRDGILKDADPNWMKKVNDDPDFPIIANEINNRYQELYKSKKKLIDFEWWTNPSLTPWASGKNTRNVYEGNLFIPIVDEASTVAGLISKSNPQVPKEYMTVEHQYAMDEYQNQINERSNRYSSSDGLFK